MICIPRSSRGTDHHLETQPSELPKSANHQSINLRASHSRTAAKTTSQHHHPQNRNKNGLQTSRLLPPPPLNNTHPLLRRPYAHHLRRSDPLPPHIHHHTNPQRNLQPSPARLQNRASGAKAHIPRSRQQAGDEGRVFEGRDYEAEEA